MKMREHLSREDTLEILGISIEHDGIRDFEEAHQLFIEYANDRYGDEDHYRIDARRVNNFDEMFFVKRNWASDLWNAAPHIANLAFKDFIISAPKSPGQGPICNCDVQSNNYTVGICCAYLMDHGLVKQETSFANFDT